MSQINSDPRLPQGDDVRQLKSRMYEIHRDLSAQINATSSGAIAGAYNAATAAPTEGKYAVGDIVRNSAPVELGTAGSRYVLFGWQCMAAPRTFVQLRMLTGN